MKFSIRHLSIFSILSILTGSAAIMAYDYGYSDSSYSYPGSSSSGYGYSDNSYSYPGSSSSGYYDSGSSYSYPGSSSSGYYDSGSSYSYPGSSSSGYYDSGSSSGYGYGDSSYNNYGQSGYGNYNQSYGYDAPPGPKERPSGSSSYSNDYYGDDSWAKPEPEKNDWDWDSGYEETPSGHKTADAGQDIPDDICSQYKSKREFLLKEHPDKVCPNSTDADCMKKASERFAIINNKCF